MVFLDEGALKLLQESEGWKRGRRLRLPDHVGNRGCHRYAEMKDPIVAFVLNQKGLDVQPVVRKEQNSRSWINTKLLYGLDNAEGLGVEA